MTRFTMAASALVLALFGFAASFLPQELLRLMGSGENLLATLAVQLLGALYLGFALMNWMAKDSLIGGIYNRPVAIANVLHFTAGALALSKGAAAGADPYLILPFLAVYWLFAVLFGRILFTSPKPT